MVVEEPEIMPDAPDVSHKNAFAKIKQQLKGTISRTMPHKKEKEKKELDELPCEVEEESDMTLKMRATSVNRIIPIYKGLSRTPLKKKQ